MVRETIEKNNMLSFGDNVVVGVSGGPDSVCLLHILNELRDDYGLKLYVAHVNHQLRGEAADGDQAYVEDLCRRMDIPFYPKSVDIRKIASQKGISEELAGREERYAHFFALARKIGTAKIAVAQNMNDQVETAFMRFIRGAGLEGLSGIKPVRKDGVIRPLLNVKRQEIEEYCSRYRLNPRIDHTNLQPVYTRNKIRMELIPEIIEKYNPNFMNTTIHTTEMIKEENDFVDHYVESLVQDHMVQAPGKVFVPIGFMLQQHIAIRRRIVRKAIEILKGDNKDIEYKHTEEILNMIRKGSTGLAIDLPDRLRCEVIYDRICFYIKKDNQLNGLVKSKPAGFSYPLKVGEAVSVKEIDVVVTMEVIERADLKNIKLNDFIKAFDYNEIKEAIYIRSRIQGDVFRPLGMRGTKKLKDFFIDEKIPRGERDTVPLIVAGDDILWVVGHRMGDKFKCTNSTAKVLIINVTGGAAR